MYHDTYWWCQWRTLKRGAPDLISPENYEDDLTAEVEIMQYDGQADRWYAIGTEHCLWPCQVRVIRLVTDVCKVDALLAK